MTASQHPPLLIQVVPRLIPGRCGISDHVVPLAHELMTRFGIDSAFVVLNSDERTDVPFATVYCKATSLVESCLQLVQGRTGAVLVHVSGYGYSADGAPTLLADALEKAQASGRLRTAAYFHETFAKGPPWKSAFWDAGRQKKALRRIVAQSRLIVTSIARNAEWLERESRNLSRVPVERIAVFSTVGEADALVPFAERNAVMAVFGLAVTRKRSYRQLASGGELLGKLGIEKILDVGPDCDAPSQVSGIPVKRMGQVPAEQLPALFSTARFGFVPHPWFCFAKSSVLAAYCAQGMIPVMTEEFPEESDGLQDGVQVVSPRTADAVRRSGWEACSRAGWEWYMGHRLRVHAERYARWMGDVQ